MVKKNKISTMERKVVFTMTIPKEYAWDFMKNFGHVFSWKNHRESSAYLKAVEEYDKASAFIVKITVVGKEEKIFKAFLREFREERKISSRKSK